jgi:hypothetical protein
MLNATLLAMVWKAHNFKHKRQGIWLFLSGLFCFFAIDELFSVHEWLSPFFRSALGASGVFNFAWIIPYGIGVIFLAIFVIPIVWNLDHKVRFWFASSALMFVTGTIGVEMLEGWYLDIVNPQRDVVYFFLMTLEESMEMTGLVMMAYASLLLLQRECGGFSVHLPGIDNGPPSSNESDAGDGK